MVDENSLGLLGPHIVSVEGVSDAVYSVEGHGFQSGFRVEVRDGVGQLLPGVTRGELSGARFTLTLPYATPGPCALVVINPDGRTSTQMFATPETSVSNAVLRADS